jgi:hypothetical protein
VKQSEEEAAAAASSPLLEACQMSGHARRDDPGPQPRARLQVSGGRGESLGQVRQKRDEAWHRRVVAHEDVDAEPLIDRESRR